MSLSTKLLIGAIPLLLVACDSGSFNEIQPGVKLIGTIESYTRSGSLLPDLREQYGQVEMLESSELAPDDPRPPFSMVSVLVVGFDHCGQEGQARISFFNDRLMSIWFYPADMELCFASEDGIRVKGSPTRIRSHVLSWAAVDYRGKAYLAWEDERLRKQADLWIREYS